MTTPRTTVDESLPVTRIVVTGDLAAERVVVDIEDQPRIAVTNTGEDITVTISQSAAGVNSVNGLQGDVTLTTTNIAEGTNLYYTTARANSDFDTRFATKTTTNLAEGTNLYYTDARARASNSAGTGITYNPTTGVIGCSITQSPITAVTDITQVFAYATNADSVTILKGQPVYMYAATGNRVSVKLASNLGDSTSAKTMGLAYQDISAGTPGYIITQGVVDGLNLGSYNAGDTLYLGATAGTLTATKPYAPNHLVYIGVVERANNGNGQIYVKPQNGYELDEIHDVDLRTSSPSAGQVLRRNPGNTLWVNETLDTDDIGEGSTNQYWTTARGNSNFDTRLATKTTDNLTEGSTNLYFTNQRAIDAVGGSSAVITPARWNSPYTQNSAIKGYAQWAAGGSTNLTVFNTSSANDLTALTVTGFNTHTQPLQKWTASGSTVASISPAGVLTAGSLSLTTYPTTDVITEGSTNKYFSNTLARGALSGSTGVTYNSSTGTISIGQAVGTTDSPTFATTTTNLATGKYVLGQLIASRNTSWTVPSSGLTTLDGTNGFAVSSTSGGTNGYGAGSSVTYYSGDTTAGINSSANFAGRGASGTSSSPSAASSGQTLLTLNADGYATSGWASTIATTNSGAGTTGINPAQLQFYTREAFADNGTSVTNAGMGMRVRLFNSATAMSVANRINIIDHTTSLATYRAATFNIQATASATNYAVFASGGHTIGQVDAPVSVQRNRTTAGVSPSFAIQNYRSDVTVPADNDGTGFRSRTLGSNNTVYTISDISSTYKTGGDHIVGINIASGDQTGSTLTSVQTFSTKPTSTIISAGTAGSSASVSAKLTVDANKVSPAVPVAYPAYTTTQRDALSPSAGWVLWNSTLTKLQVYTGSAWVDLH
jgi:hypothetical protein